MAIPIREPGSDDDVETRFPLNPLPVDEFLSREAPPLAWLVPGLVPARGVTLMVSPPNAGKTLLALDYAAQAAAVGRKVLFIEEEGSLRGLQERVRRAVAAAGLLNGKANLLEIDWHPQFSLMDASKRQYLVALMEAKKAELVVLDSLAAVSPGSDENDPADMGLVSETLHWIHAETDSAVLALHHTTKETWKPGQTPNLASARGHGALMGRVDSALALVPLEASPGVVRFELYNVKQREAERARKRTLEVLMSGPAAIIRESDSDYQAQDELTKVREMLGKVTRAIPVEGYGYTSRQALTRELVARGWDVSRAVTMLIERGIVVEPVNGKLMRKKETGGT